MLHYDDEIYSFRTDEQNMTAEPRDGLIDEPADIDDIPLRVLQHVQNIGYRILGSSKRADVLDEERSEIESYELWV